MIIKKIIIILLIIPIFLFSQKKSKNQNIELPEFVITGVQKISFPIMKKHRPKLIHVISDKYFKPYISPDKLSLASFSKPQSLKILVHKPQHFFNGEVEVGAGIYTQPIGKFNYHINKGYTHIYANIEGVNIQDYVPNANFNSTKFKFGSDFTISRNSKFLPGSKFSVQGDYKKSQYYLFASSTPKLERKNEYGTGTVKFQNYFSKKFNYVLLGKIKNMKFHENDLNDLEEMTISGKARFRYNWEKFSILGTGVYKTQWYKNSIVSSKNNFMYGGKFLININPSNIFSVNFGAVYAKQDTNLLIQPIIELTAGIDKGITLIVKYEPSAEFKTISDFQKENRYLKKFNLNNLFTMRNNDFTLALQYQYYKYFEINGGVNYRTVENMPFYEGGINQKDFEIKTSDYIKTAELFLNLLFYNGPYGYFYGSVKLQDSKFRSEKHVPYSPLISSNLTYGFNIFQSLKLKLGLEYFSKAYINSANSTEIPANINGNAEVEYELTKNLSVNVKFENLLNRNNYLYFGYKEKPFDVIGGISYMW